MPASVPDILKDPKFQSLAPAERVKVLETVDPNFAGLPVGEKLKVVTGAVSGTSQQGVFPGGSPVLPSLNGGPVADFGMGLAKSAGGSIVGAGQIVNDVSKGFPLQGVYGLNDPKGISDIIQPGAMEQTQGAMVPSNRTEALGKTIGNIAQMSVPIAGGGGGVLARALTQGLGTGTIGAVQGGSVTSPEAVGGFAGGTGGALAGEGLRAGMSALSSRLLKSIVGSGPDAEVAAQTIKDYGFPGATRPALLKNAEEASQLATKSLKDTISKVAAAAPDETINVKSIFNDAVDSYTKGGGKGAARLLKARDSMLGSGMFDNLSFPPDKAYDFMAEVSKAPGIPDAVKAEILKGIQSKLGALDPSIAGGFTQLEKLGATREALGGATPKSSVPPLIDMVLGKIPGVGTAYRAAKAVGPELPDMAGVMQWLKKQGSAGGYFAAPGGE